MEKTIEQRAEDFAVEKAKCVGCSLLSRGCPSTTEHIGCAKYNRLRRTYLLAATEHKAIDDEAYRKDMRYVGVKQEELIDKVVECLKDICNDIVDEETGILPFPDNYWLDHFKPQILAQIHEELKLT